MCKENPSPQLAYPWPGAPTRMFNPTDTPDCRAGTSAHPSHITLAEVSGYPLLHQQFRLQAGMLEYVVSHAFDRHRTGGLGPVADIAAVRQQIVQVDHIAGIALDQHL